MNSYSLDRFQGKFKTGTASFIMEEMPIVTSSPIEGRLIETSGFNQNLTENLPTWSALLKDYKGSPRRKSQTTVLPHRRVLASQTLSSDNTSTSFETIAEHKMRILVTPNRKMKIVSSSSRKNVQNSPKQSYTRLNKEYQLHKDNEQYLKEVKNIKEKLQLNKINTLEDVSMYEKILKDYISKKKSLVHEEVVPNEIANTALMNFVENELGNLQLSPSSSHILKLHQEEQEKRLIKLAIAKRRCSAEIRGRIKQQQLVAQQQVHSYKKKNTLTFQSLN